ncbi:MAG: DUF2959 domain-containing protein [Acidobacteria bacterium]|nr:DUF2959 domain-containing protein [Acidobacteriota bacterium]
MGNEKRDILVDHIKKGREEQQKAKKEYHAAADRSHKVTSRIASIEQVSGDMFSEWKKEIGNMCNADLKRRSSTLMKDIEASAKEADEFIASLPRGS